MSRSTWVTVTACTPEAARHVFTVPCTPSYNLLYIVHVYTFHISNTGIISSCEVTWTFFLLLFFSYFAHIAARFPEGYRWIFVSLVSFFSLTRFQHSAGAAYFLFPFRPTAATLS